MYNIDLIKKFINPYEDLGNYSREELSDNQEFMLEVFKYSEEYRLFYSCSERLRKDLSFIKQLIAKSNNKNFITNMTRCFLATSDNEIDKLDLSITAESLLPPDDEETKDFRYINVTSYFDVKARIAREDLDNPDLEAILEDKFPRIMELCNNNETVLNYYARMMIDEIYHWDENLFFKYLSDEFDSISKYTDEYIAIKYVSEYDAGLGKYLTKHFEPLRRLVMLIERKREYNGDTSIDRFKPMNDVVHEYMTKIGKGNREEELLYYILRKSGHAVRYAFANQMLLDEVINSGRENDDDLEYAILNDRELEEVVSNIKKIMITEVFQNKRVNVDKMIKESNKRLKLGLSDNNPDNNSDDSDDE